MQNRIHRLHLTQLLVICLLLFGEEPIRVGGRTKSVREVRKAEHLFCVVHQSAVAIAGPEIRS